jgi:MoxR-like ATPase
MEHENGVPARLPGREPGMTYGEEAFADDLSLVSRFHEDYVGFLESRIVGNRAVVERLFLSFLCEGNILLEGPPGLGKTSLAKAWADFLGLDFRRIQFTPDLMPLDVIGSTMIEADESGRRSYRFVKGPLFANVVLGDEINRATPKTQSAFLEAMEEKKVTFLGETRDLPSPFFVLATQNPIELEGTYPLPEAQIDRFLMRLFFEMPDFGALRSILDAAEGPRLGRPAGPARTGEALAAHVRAAAAIVVPEAVRNFIVRLVVETQPGRSKVEAVRKYVRYGASPRCAIGLLRAARARAVTQGRPNVSFEDVGELFPDLANHRVLLDFEAAADGVKIGEVLAAVLSAARREYLGSA